MRIEELYIDGFGRFSGLSLKQIPSGLSVILGDNEAGKSTLLAFLRSVLFGLPSRNQKDFYPAFKGGRKGGRIVLIDRNHEEIVVERCEGKGAGPLTVTFADGRTGGEEEFRPLIGSATADLYQSVFAFSLSELQEFESLNTEKVRDAIYSAGVGVGRRTLTDVSKDLAKRSGELFSPGGSKPQMNKLLSQIEKVHSRIKEHSQDQERYEQARSQLETFNTAVEKVGAELHTARQRFRRVETLEQAWDDWVELASERRQLKEIPVVESFPPGGIVRLDALSPELRGLRDQLSEISSEQEQAVSSLETVRFDDLVFGVSEEIRRLERGRELFESSLQRLTEQRTACELAEQSLSNLLAELGDGWDEKRLAAFSLSQADRAEFDEGRRRMSAAAESARDRSSELKRARQDSADSDEAVATIRGEQQQLPKLAADKKVAEARKAISGRNELERFRRDLSDLKQQRDLGLDALHDSLRQVGAEWTEDRLREFDTSMAVQDQIASHRTCLSDLLDKHRLAMGRVEDADRAHADAKLNFSQADELLASLPMPAESDESVLLDRRRAIRSLRASSSEVEFLKEKQADIAERLSDLEAQLERQSHVGQSRNAELFPAWMPVAVVLVGVAGLLGLGLGRNDWLAGGIVLALMFALAVLLFFLRRASSQRGRVEEEQRTRDREELVARRETLLKSADDVVRRLEELDGRIVESVTSAGLNARFDTRDLDDAEADVEAAIDLLRRRRPAEQKRKDAQTSFEKSGQALADMQGCEIQLNDQLNDADEKWRHWLKSVGLSVSLTPESAQNVLARLDATREQLKSVDRDRAGIDRIENSLQDCESRVRTVAAEWFSEDEVKDDVLQVVDDLAVRLDQHDRDVQIRDELQRRLKEAEERVAAMKRRVDEASASHRESVDDEQQAAEGWSSLLLRIGLESTLSAENAPQALQSIEHARAQLDAVKGKRASRESLLESIESYRRDAVAMAEAAGLAKTSDDDASRVVGELIGLLDQEVEARRKADGLTEKVAQADNRILRIRRQIEERQREIRDLFALAESEDEESFRQRAGDFELRCATRKQIEQRETRLRQLGGSGDGLQKLEQELQLTSPDDLSREKDELDERIEAFEQQHTDAADERGRLKQQLDQLEKTDELSRLRIEEQSNRSEFESAAVEWSVQKIAAFLIDRARIKYERERRPAVLREAESYLSRFTGGRYSAIRPADDGSRVVVQSPDGLTKETDQLSRGTAEQLYLSLRFGFVSEFVRHFEPLPLVFDDILVNFDPDRARAAAESILSLSESQQILFFTCQPTTVKLFRDIRSDVSTFELKDGGFE